MTATHARVNSIRTSREKEPLQETEFLNQSMNLPPQPSFVKHEIHPVQSQTSPSFYPPIQRHMEPAIIK